jgi:hypothetical protein
MSSTLPAGVGRQLPRGHLLVLTRSFRRTLEAENKSPRTASMGTGLSREARDVLSDRYATSPESSYTGYSTTKGPAQQGY